VYNAALRMTATLFVIAPITPCESLQLPQDSYDFLNWLSRIQVLAKVAVGCWNGVGMAVSRITRLRTYTYCSSLHRLATAIQRASAAGAARLHLDMIQASLRVASKLLIVQMTTNSSQS